MAVLRRGRGSSPPIPFARWQIRKLGQGRGVTLVCATRPHVYIKATHQGDVQSIRGHFAGKRPTHRSGSEWIVGQPSTIETDRFAAWINKKMDVLPVVQAESGRSARSQCPLGANWLRGFHCGRSSAFARTSTNRKKEVLEPRGCSRPSAIRARIRGGLTFGSDSVTKATGVRRRASL